MQAAHRGQVGAGVAVAGGARLDHDARLLDGGEGPGVVLGRHRVPDPRDLQEADGVFDVPARRRVGALSGVAREPEPRRACRRKRSDEEPRRVGGLVARQVEPHLPHPHAKR